MPRGNPNTFYAAYRSEWRCWHNIKARCYSPSATGYKHNGGQGITMATNWRKSFAVFLHDMGKRPSPRHKLIRLDNSGNYEPLNCIWSTRRSPTFKAAAKKTRHPPLTYGGETLSYTEWSERLGVRREKIPVRLRAGWTAGQALELEAPPGRAVIHYECQGRRQTLAAWAAERGLKRSMIYSRITSLGWTMEQALGFVPPPPEAEPQGIQVQAQAAPVRGRTGA